MTRVFLAAGVAALAIAVPATAGPGGHGNQERQQQAQRQGGGGGGRAAAMRGAFAPRQERQAFAAPRVERQRQFAAIERPQRAERVQMQAQRQQMRQERVQQAQARVADRQQVRANREQAQARMAERQQVRANRQQAQNRMAQRQQMQANRQQAQQRMAQRQQMQANRQQAQTRMAQRQQMQANRQQAQTRMAQQQQLRANRQQQVQARMAQQQQLRANRQQQVQAQIAERQQLRANRINERVAGNNGVGFGVGGCPPGLAGKGCTPPGIARQQQLQNLPLVRQQQMMALSAADPQVFRQSRIQMLAPRTQIVGPVQAVQFVGQPLSTVSNVVPLEVLPASLGYLYPTTPNYYYQYGGGYLYQVDRSTSLIDALIPLLAGGFLPGTTLPSAYMSSYVPNYYGLNSFYPSSYGPGYGYGYDNLCNRYANGVIYQVDCFTGMVQNVIPMYAGGYGVGQMLPSAYNYYNVPMQYRDMYYPTADASYWYAPGAIYQYDPSTSLITSVAALMSPGFTIGQSLPAGYGMYNVPLAYRSTYYDTPDAWYRYNNGYIYQVNPTTQLVTAIVASLLT